MSVISNNTGPFAVLTSISPANDFAVLTEILMEIRQLNFYLKQLPLYLNTGRIIDDEDADFRNSMTSSDVSIQSNPD